MLVRFGQRLLLSGGRRGASVWELSASGQVETSYNIRALHDEAVQSGHLPLATFKLNQTFPAPLNNGESTSYMSLLRLSDSEGVIVYDMLANSWAGPLPGGAKGEYGHREDHVFAMRFRLGPR